jgi:SAM-dependent MidA family methyltransferase
LVRTEMAADSRGRISFERFMELALYAPGLGYYSAGARKIGAAGDFVTAPEISPIFSRCVARQCRQVLAETGGGILELGAGSGLMAAEVMLELERLNALPECYGILEVSADLRQRQQMTFAEKIPHLQERVIWLEALPEPGFRGVVVANEVLDAMPVQRFRITGQGPRSLHVGWARDRFIWRESDEQHELTTAIEGLEQELGWTFPVGYESERNPRLEAWIAALARILDGGMLLLIDYGYPRREYYHPQRTTGTLICHYRHRAHENPLILLGLQDISASVDFTEVADAALKAGLDVLGYTSQACFLFGCGIEDFLAGFDCNDHLRQLEQARQVKLLTLPGEMGERFKAIALARGLDSKPLGFTYLDERKRL